MGEKSALIVDDSRTAREALRRMLEVHELRVETAESAEAALLFLTAHRPDVIFMDHMMPGMDGFQAVKAIKENPSTATIPVMMYTSQSGALYVGQARALGAVGVLPKQIKPVEVTEVLRTLHLLPGQTGTFPARRATDVPGLAGVDAVHSPADWQDLHRWLHEMLADQNRALRSDVEQSVSRVLTEHLSGPGSSGSAAATRGIAGRPAFWPAGAVITALAATAAVFLWLHLDSGTRWQVLARQNLDLLAALDARRASELAMLLPENTAGPDRDDGVRDPAIIAAALEWSVNQDASYPPENLPFDDLRLEQLAGLVERLRELEFRGTVRLIGHVGDFCWQRTGDTGWRLAPDDIPVSRCDRIGLTPDDARTESARQSVAFANFVSLLILARDPVRVEIEPMGNGRPHRPYPALAAEPTAGEWNRVARQNQRVTVELVPDTVTAVRNQP